MRLLILCLSAALLLPGAEWKQLFNGKDLSGWKMVGPGRFVVEDHMLKTEGGMGLLFYEGEKFGNQTLRVVFKAVSPKANSGVFIRLPEKPADPWYGVHNGYEVQIDAAGDDWHSTGALYSLSKITKRAQKPQGEWNTMDIKLDGQKTTVYLNGTKLNEFVGTQDVPPRKEWYEPVRGPRPEMGYIGLQNHDEQSVVYFKEVSVGSR
ncbi:MAG: 3-keto-disaccharide hydrolase [Bryobacteraceae bacterium]